MNSSSMLLLLVLVGVLAGALFLLPAAQSPVAAGGGQASAVATPLAAAGTVTVNAGEDRTAGERETIDLRGTGSDSSGGDVSYSWTADSDFGFFSDPTRPDSKFTAPSACDCCTTVTLTLTATGPSGASASDSMVVHVRDVIGCRERACAETIVVAPPCSATIARSRCPKPDVPCADPCVSEAPATPPCTQVPVPCRCSEGCGPVWDSAWPQVVPALSPEGRPTPRIVRQFAPHVAEGSATPLRAVVNNPSCSSVCFAWSASQGRFEHSDTLEPTYHAPLTDLAQGEQVVITFTIHDASGRPSYDQIRIRVDDVPAP